MKENQRGLSFSDINTDWKLVLDADNVFWGLAPKNDNGDFLLPEDLIKRLISIKSFTISGSMRI